MESGSIARQIRTHIAHMSTTGQCICVKMCAQTEVVAPVSLVSIGKLLSMSEFNTYDNVQFGNEITVSSTQTLCQSQLEVIFYLIPVTIVFYATSTMQQCHCVQTKHYHSATSLTLACDWSL